MKDREDMEDMDDFEDMEDMDGESREIIQKEILKVVRNQLRSNNPPETKKTLNRLMSQNIQKDDAMKLIGCVMQEELLEIDKQQRMFDEEKYVKALQALPKLPWDTEYKTS